MTDRPELDLTHCNLCGGCVEVCPEVFRITDADIVEIIDLDHYPEDCVNEAIKYCPRDCIYWIGSFSPKAARLQGVCIQISADADNPCRRIFHLGEYR